MLRLLIICFLLLGVSSARAEIVYKVSAGSWTVTALKESCSAVNRPHSETRDIPVNAMFISSNAKGELSISIALWPEALSEQDTELRLFVSGYGSFRLPAKSQFKPWVAITTTEPLPEKLLDTLKGRRGPFPLYDVLVRTNASKSRTVFDLQDLPQVMMELSTCTEKLAKGG